MMTEKRIQCRRAHAMALRPSVIMASSVKFMKDLFTEHHIVAHSVFYYIGHAYRVHADTNRGDILGFLH